MLVAMVAHGPGVALFLTNMPVFFFNTDGSVQCFFTTKYIPTSVQYRFSIYSFFFFVFFICKNYLV